MSDAGDGAPHGAVEGDVEAAIARRVKAELRKRMRGLRRTAPSGACLERSRAIVAALAGLDEVKAARAVALFWPIEARHEVDLRSFDAALRAAGATIYYPAIDPESGAMTFREGSEATLEEQGYGFAEPPATAREPEALDLVIVPALAVAPSGHRLGYGAGYYDRTLPRFAPPAKSIVVAYDYQLLADVPTTPGDVACDLVVTDRRILRVT